MSQPTGPEKPEFAIANSHASHQRRSSCGVFGVPISTARSEQEEARESLSAESDNRVASQLNGLTHRPLCCRAAVGHLRKMDTLCPKRGDRPPLIVHNAMTRTALPWPMAPPTVSLSIPNIRRDRDPDSSGRFSVQTKPRGEQNKRKVFRDLRLTIMSGGGTGASNWFLDHALLRSAARSAALHLIEEPTPKAIIFCQSSAARRGRAE